MMMMMMMTVRMAIAYYNN